MKKWGLPWAPQLNPQNYLALDSMLSPFELSVLAQMSLLRIQLVWVEGWYTLTKDWEWAHQSELETKLVSS